MERGKLMVPMVALLMTVLLGAFAIGGCGSTAEPSAAGPLSLGPEANGTAIRLAPGQSLEISLPGNPTTGYSWTVESAAAPQLRMSGEPTYVPESTDTTLVGGGGTYTFSFQGEESGSARLELAYHRTWETGVAPLESFSLDVTVE